MSYQAMLGFMMFELVARGSGEGIIRRINETGDPSAFLKLTVIFAKFHSHLPLECA